PCQMPEDLLELIIKTSSNEEDIVLDPFGGTGTTAAVAKKLKRNYLTMEISQDYYNIILKRLEGKIPLFRRKNAEEQEKQKTLFDIE
ncbi:MAG TPA: site-specific DNA-methyltransferase, partial [Paludibacteraceae bacterium]|nr:site-specific DNA-methyltransferase [Paludibacteraceae bacterium]